MLSSRIVLVAVLACVWAEASRAQQVAPNPDSEVCQRSLQAANGQLIALTLQSQALSKQLEETKAELAKKNGEKPVERNHDNQCLMLDQ
jgi:hypothetical protein